MSETTQPTQAERLFPSDAATQRAAEALAPTAQPSVADLLFPSTAPQQAKPQQPAAQPAQQPAAQPQPGQQQPGQQPAQQQTQETKQQQPQTKQGEPGDISWLDQAHPDTAAVAPVIQALKLGKDQVGQLVALRSQLDTQQAEAWAAESLKAFAGAEGSAVLADARQAVSLFGTAELKAILNRSGLGNHPAVIRAFAAAIRGGRR